MNASQFYPLSGQHVSERLPVLPVNRTTPLVNASQFYPLSGQHVSELLQVLPVNRTPALVSASQFYPLTGQHVSERLPVLPVNRTTTALLVPLVTVSLLLMMCGFAFGGESLYLH